MLFFAARLNHQDTLEELLGPAQACLTNPPYTRLCKREMQPPSQDNLPPEIELALAYTAQTHRNALTIFFDLDLRLGRILAGTSEPMLGQMRLAWWRDTLGKPISERPTGDTLLDAISDHWAGREAALIELVDAWEHLLAEPPLGEAHATSFVEGRIAGLRACFGDRGADWDRSNASSAAWLWAIADLATSVSQSEEREMLVQIGMGKSGDRAKLPSPFKGIAILGALGLRSLEKGGRPLMEGRGASVTALRAGIFGR